MSPGLLSLSAAVLVLLLAPLSGQSPAEGKRLRALFSKADKDGSQSLTQAEWRQSTAAFRALDRNGDDAISFAEWLASEAATNLLNPQEAQSESALRKRLRLVTRFDKNKDGQVSRSEWTGDAAAFASLDLDGNGTVDSRDAAKLPRAESSEDSKIPENTARRLPNTNELLEKFDRNNDRSLSASELRGAKVLRPLLGYADTNRDGALSSQELSRLIVAVRMHVDAKERGAQRPTAQRIPLTAWDKDKDGRLDQDEFLQYKALFPILDRNRDAAVTAEEIERFRRRVEERGFLDRFDLDGNGRVTKAEFDGPAPAFARADRNGDGVISKGDR